MWSLDRATDVARGAQTIHAMQSMILAGDHQRYPRFDQRGTMGGRSKNRASGTIPATPRSAESANGSPPNTLPGTLESAAGAEPRFVPVSNAPELPMPAETAVPAPPLTVRRRGHLRPFLEGLNAARTTLAWFDGSGEAVAPDCLRVGHE